MVAEVVSHRDYFNWSLNYLSREFGLARETVAKRLASAGVEPSGMKRGHPVYSVKSSAMAILLPNHDGGDIGLIDPSKMAPSDRRHHYAAERDRVALDRELGQSVSVEESRVQMAAIVNIGLPIFESLADELERDFNLPPKVIEGIEKRVDALRNRWADALEDSD